jgi:hypothetical protein
MLPRGGPRPSWRLRRPKRLALYHDAGAKALAAEVIIQAIGEVREGLAHGWVLPDGTTPTVDLQPYKWSQYRSVIDARSYQRQQRKIVSRVRIVRAVEFLKDKAQLSFWLQLAQYPESPAEFVRQFWRQMRVEHLANTLKAKQES